MEKASQKKDISINDVLRLAFDIAASARKEDAMGNLKGAFELYTQALESFMIVYKQEKNPQIKEQLKQTILADTSRAEQVKEMLVQQPQQQMAFQQQQMMAANPQGMVYVSGCFYLLLFLSLLPIATGWCSSTIPCCSAIANQGSCSFSHSKPRYGCSF